MNNAIYDTSNLPGTYIDKKAVFYTEDYTDVGETILIKRGKLIRLLSEKICSDSKYVKFSEKDGLVEMNASLIILTKEEYENLCMTQFKRGMQRSTKPLSPIEVRLDYRK